MVIRGTPRTEEMRDYYMADNETAFILQQKNINPVYIDYDATYFRLNKKLKKILDKLGISY